MHIENRRKKVNRDQEELNKPLCPNYNMISKIKCTKQNPPFTTTKQKQHLHLKIKRKKNFGIFLYD